MTTDNKTLADVQPGGRVRLGDGLPPCPFCGHSNFDQWPCEYIDASGANVVRCARCHAAAPMKVWHTLSAQPSPGGQGDAWDIAELVRTDLDRQSCPDAYMRIAMESVVKHLAARQSVGKHGEGDEFLAGICVALQCVTAQDSGVLWAEIVRAVGVDDLLQYATFIEPEEWDLAGFSTYASIELGRRKPRSKASKQAKRPPAQAVDLGAGVKAIAAERERQLQAEGFSRDCDQQYREGELARAATAYVQLAAMDLQVGTRSHIALQEPPFFWPWAPEWWKPVDARRDLVRAGALIAAQIDLIDSQAVGK